VDIDFARVVDSLTEGLYIVDTNRRIVFWNGGAERITGWKASEVVGSFCADGILEHLDGAGHHLCHDDFCPLNRTIRTAQPQKTSSLVYSLTRRGERVPVEVTTAALRGASGEVIGGVEVFRDISEAVEDLRRARLLQMAAMTITPPRAPGLEIQIVYNPRDIVGGDFCMAESAGEEGCSFILADVTNHGVTAALSTLLLRKLWEDLRGEITRPERLAGLLNQRLLSYTGDSGYFASALAGRFETAAGVFRFCSMGGPPFFQLSGGGELSVRSFPGHLLGVAPDPEYEADTVTLHGGDRLLFVTDGGFEAANSAGEVYGIERLADRFRSIGDHPSLEAFCSSLQLDMLAFSGMLRLADDFTAVLVTVL
jgi:phosphoserine phosphatase RsbU/P